MWKNLGTRRGWPVRIVKFYAQKSWPNARKMLVTRADSAIIRHGSRERRPLASGVGDPSGGGSSTTEVRGRARGPPRRALRAMQPAPYRDGCVEAGVPTLPLQPLGHVGRLPRRRTSPDPRRVLRSAADEWWRVRREGKHASRALHWAGTGDERRSARMPLADGATHPIAQPWGPAAAP